MLRLLIHRQLSFGRPVEIAVCVVCKKTDRIQTAAQLETALTAACTKWAKETEAGRGAYGYSGGDFNFGDLSNYVDSTDSEYIQPDASLLPYFEAEGIEGFQMFGFDDNGGMTYDTCLMKDIDEDE